MEFKLGNGGADLMLQQVTSSSAHLLSLAGGGIKAMTADAGLFAGLLKHFASEGEPTTIGNLLSKVSALSANSGSSWFIDLLAYVPKFVASLQNYTDFFSPDGYMGKLKTAYDNYAALPSNSINDSIIAILNKIGDLAGMNLAQLYGLLDKSSINWNDFLSNVIFQPYDSAELLQSVNFHSGSLRTDSLPSQSLIFQSSISSNEAAINKYSIFPPNETVATITNAGTDSSGHTYIFIPAVITSLGSETDVSAPALPSILTGSLDVTYSTYDTPFGDPSATTVLANFNFDGLSAFLATSASSAALSAVASGGVYDSSGRLLSTLLFEFQDISPLVQVNDAGGASTASDPAPDILNGDTTPDFLVTRGNSLLRLADGAYVDNTSVTSGLTYLQANNQLSNFTVTALTYFDGIDENLAKINPGYNNIGQEAAVLFTGSNQNQTEIDINLSHPSAAVFDSAATTGLDKPMWEYIGSNGFKLDYFQLGVTTAANDIGIAQGEEGTLDLWVVTTTVPALPSLNEQNPEQSWDQYSDLYDQIILGLQSVNNSHAGADLLAYSLGLISTVPFVGGPGDDILTGSLGADILEAGAGNDIIIADAGNDTLDGGTDLDTAIIADTLANSILQSTATGAWSLTSNEGTDLLFDVERLQFSDGILALDLEGNAGQAYRLYQAAFDRTPDEVGLGYWITALDNGYGLKGAALSFIDSAEFKANYGDPGTVSNAQFITLLYANALDRAPDQAGFEFWLNALNSGLSREAMLASFSESAEHKQTVIGAIENGIEYIPWLA